MFQPGAQVYPPPNPTPEVQRHRKAASAGATPGFNPATFNSPLNAFAPGLKSMAEDVIEEVDFNDQEEEQDTFPPAAPPARHIAQSSMGNFTAPRFTVNHNQPPPHMQTQQLQQLNDNDSVGPTGRPQLAPGFMFGAQRRAISGSAIPAIGEDDVGFQFPQQQQNLMDGQSGHPLHRRTPSEMAGVSPLMAEQVGGFLMFCLTNHLLFLV